MGFLRCCAACARFGLGFGRAGRAGLGLTRRSKASLKLCFKKEEIINTRVHNRRHDYWSFLTKRRDHFEGWPQKKKLTQTTFALMKVSLYIYLGQLVVMLLSTVHLAFIGISMWIEAS